MTLALLSLLALSPKVFYFSGGSGYKLAHALADQFDRPAVVMASSAADSWPLIRVAYEDDAVLLKGLRQKLNADSLSLGVYGIGLSQWPETFYFTERRGAF